MKKLLITIALAGCCTLGAFAQKASFSLGLGVASPSGDFASSALTNSNAGFADLGANIELGFTSLFINDMLGIKAAIRGTAFGVSEQIGDGFVLPGSPADVETGNYGIAGFSLGIATKFDLIADKLSLGLAFSPGIYYYASPEIDLIITNNSGGAGVILSQPSAQNTGLGLSFQPSLRFMLTKNISFSIDYDMFWGSTEFDFENPNGTIVSDEQSFSWQTIGVGFGVHF